MGEPPFVSVIVPAYNVAPFLHESLGSLVRQSLQNIEIICVNDGSTDESLSIMQEYAAKDSRIRIIDKPNGGYGHAMNRGLAAASGEYIGILEPDDFADPEMFECLYQTASETNADIVKSDYWEYKGTDGANNYVRLLALDAYNTSCKEYGKVYVPGEVPSITTIIPCIWSAIYRKEMLKRNGIAFNETPGASFQDTSFSFIALACAERVVFVNKAFIHYRVDNANSSVKSKAKVFSICDEFRKIDAFINAKKERREKFGGAVQVFKLRSYEGNYARIALEYKRMFSVYMGIEFLNAEYEGFLHEEDFTTEEWTHVRGWIDRYNYTVNAEDIFLNSPTYKIGSVFTWLPRKIRCLAKKQY